MWSIKERGVTVVTRRGVVNKAWPIEERLQLIKEGCGQ